MILAWVTIALAQTEPGSTDFAEALHSMGQSEAAWLEYERAAYSFGPGPAADRARYAGCAALGSADDALECWRHAAAQAEPASVAAFELGLAEARYARGELAAAQSRLVTLGEGPYADVVAYRSAWIALREGDEDAACLRLAAVPDGSPLAAPARAFAADLGAAPALPHRSPALAGALSAALPGAGQLYAGEARDGASALVLNAALIGGTVALARQKNVPGAALVGGLAVGFYAGNIFSAVNSAHRFNRRAEAARLDEWAARYELELRLAPGASAEAPRPEPHLGAR